MEQRWIHLFLLSGFLAVILCGSREYILIREYKTWKEAQDYCLKNYIGLATVQTDEEWTQLNNVRAGLQFHIWIGLYDDANSWRWSFQNETLTFFQWDYDQPNNIHGKQYCVNLRSSGYWWDEACNVTCTVFCQNKEGKPVLVSDPEMSWSKAQRFCRENHTDLFTVRNLDVNQQLTAMIQGYTCAWIGLFRDSWKWWDPARTPPPPPLPWAAGQPDNLNGFDSCAALDYFGQIGDESCSNSYFFLCQTIRVKQQVLRLELKAGDDVNNPDITAAVLNKVQQTLREQGMAADVKLVWREQPDGRVFQNMKSGSAGMNEEL